MGGWERFYYANMSFIVHLFPDSLYRLPVVMHGMFMRGSQRAMEPALTILEHSTTRME